MMSSGLFRKEAIHAQQPAWLGEISLAQPLRLWLMVTAAVVIAVAVLVFLILGTYTRRSRVTGQLVPSNGLATVLAPTTGVVSRIDTHESGAVVAGQTVAVVTVARSTMTSGDMTSALERRIAQREQGLVSSQSAQHQVINVQSTGLAKQLSAIRAELRQIDAQISTRRSQLRLANETVGRLRQLQQEKYIGELQVKQQEAIALDRISEIQVLQRQAIGARKAIAQLEQSLQELPGQRLASDATFQRDLALLEQERLETQARGELAVPAPVDGVVATQLVKKGQAVQAGQPLMVLLPGDGKLEAQLLVPSRSIGFIEAGDTVLLRYQAYPYQKFGHYRGRVASISRSALTSTEQQLLTGVDAANEQRYQVTVVLADQAVTAFGRADRLKPGMLFEADILGERRRLIEWVFEPLYSLRERFFATGTQAPSGATAIAPE